MRQVAMLRECVRERCSLWEQLDAVCSAAQPPPANWALELRARVERDRDAALRALSTAPPASFEDPTADCLPTLETAPPAFVVRDPEPAGHSASKGAGRSSVSERAAECADQLVSVSARLARIWQDELREQFQHVVDDIAEAFYSFKSNPSDNSLQWFLKRVHELEGEMRAAGQATESSDGNPFCGSDGASGLREFFATTVEAAVNGAVHTVQAESSGAIEEARRASAEAAAAAMRSQAELAETRAAAEKLAAQVGMLQRQRDQAVTPRPESAAEAVPQHPVAEKVGTPRISRSSSYSAAGSPARAAACQPTRRAAQQQFHLGTPLPSRAAPSESGASNTGSDVSSLRAALGHLEAQLASQCTHGHASATRHGHLRRRVETVRSQLERLEGRPLTGTRPF
eukprot:Hpha_TRINITY_DN4705_c0_g1::TRINITY_DN4705_c0_g1_i1::g.130487::m.130487